MNLSASNLRNLPADIYRNILALVERKPLDGICKELHTDLIRNTKGTGPGFTEQANGFVIPFGDLMQARALAATNFSGGGALVPDDLSGNIQKALRPAATIFQAGASPIVNKGNLTIGKEAAPTTFQWLSEIQAVTAVDPVFSSAFYTPHRLAGVTWLGRQLDIQTAGTVSKFLVDSLSIGAAVGLEAGALAGTGVLGEPLGLFLTPGTNAITFGGAATWNSALSFENCLAGQNADDDAVKFIAHPGVRYRWKGLQRFSAGSETLWNGDWDTVAGKDAFVTNNLAPGQICAGDWSKMGVVIFGDSMPVQITVDPFSSAENAQIKVYCTLLADTGAIRPEVFCVSFDSAVQ